MAICWGLFLALRKIGIIPPYSVQTKNHEIKGTYQTTGVPFYFGKAKIISSIGNYIIGQIVDEVLEAETSSKEPDKPTKITRLKHKIMVGLDIAPTQDANTQEPWQI